MTIYERFVAAISRSRRFSWVGHRLLTPLDRRMHRSRFAPSRIGLHVPLCFVTTTGRRSGEQRIAPLFHVDSDSGAGVVIVGTNFGTDKRPGWAYNLDADPRALVELDGTTTPMVARRADAEEFDRYFARFVAVWPNYAVYRDRVHRDVPMYVLEPAGN